MRIGIIGAGAAGLAAAWLLDDVADVTLFESENRPGGHAHTIEFEANGQRFNADGGAEFFSTAMFPLFTTLLRVLKVPLHSYPMSATLYSTDNKRITLLPPIREGKIVWSAMKPRQLAELLQFQYVLQSAKHLMEQRDISLTLEQFLESLSLSSDFKENFIYPFLLAGWCVEPDAFRRFIAYDVLRYTYMHKPTGLAPSYWVDIVGGTSSYVQALIKELRRAELRLSCPAARITRHNDTYLVEEASGRISEFDHLILATNASDACGLLRELPGLAEIRQKLANIVYFKTTIAIHGDPRLMSADKSNWSVVNIRYDGVHSSTTVWKSWRSDTPIFKSWITYETQLPEPLYALATYYHPEITHAYFEAQRSLAPIQGRDNLWFAGMYTHDVDCHESAVTSGIQVAQCLAPEAPRLKQLFPSMTQR
jgi:predicted NAD/FAD-binding protein